MSGAGVACGGSGAVSRDGSMRVITQAMSGEGGR
jgi:hypothetical protein